MQLTLHSKGQDGQAKIAVQSGSQEQPKGQQITDRKDITKCVRPAHSWAGNQYLCLCDYLLSRVAVAREWPGLLNGAETGVKIQQAVEGEPSSHTDPRCRSEMLQWGGHPPGHVLIPILQHAFALRAFCCEKARCMLC